MQTFIIRRLIMAIAVIIIVSVMVFVGMRLLPGDPILLLVSQGELQETSEAQLAALRAEFGLDKPMVYQYIKWIGGIFRGDFGQSILHRAPVAQEVIRRLPITLHLGLTALFIGLFVGIPAGIICAIRRGKFVDTIVTMLSNVGITVPYFWLGIMLIYLFGMYLHWLPIEGYTSPFDNFWLSTKRMIMPEICLVVFPIASITRQTRSSMLEVMRQDYVRTAWAKGLRERMVVFRHALKNSLIPVITLSGMSLSMIIGGSVITETVFNIPGMGRLAVTAILNQDYPYVQAIVLLLATFVMIVNLFIDFAYGWFDPRIRHI